MLIDKKELAKYLNISVSMVNKLLAQGMPHIKIGVNVRFDKDEVMAWLKNKK